MKIFSWIREKDYPVESFRIGMERSQKLKEVVFSFIEGVVIIGALEFAFSKSQSVLIGIVYLIAYVTLVSYVLGNFRYLVHVAIGSNALASRNRAAALNIATVVILAISWGTIQLLSGLTSEFIAGSILIDTGMGAKK